jgi:hypothetical protein
MGYMSAQTAGAMVIAALPPVPASNRNTIKAGMLGDSAHPSTQATMNHVDATMTGYRPNISDKGPKNNGPTAKPRIQITMLKDPMT